MVENPLNHLPSATWALVECDDAGEMIQWTAGVVPAYYPQTPQAGEFFAAMHAVQLCSNTATVYDDCSNVVKQFTNPVAEWGHEKLAYAGVMRNAARMQKDGCFGSIEKVKAPVSLVGLTGREHFLAVGNDRADKKAKETAQLHKQPDSETLKRYQMAEEQATTALKVIAAVMKLWPYAKDHKRLAKGFTQDKKCNARSVAYGTREYGTS